MLHNHASSPGAYLRLPPRLSQAMYEAHVARTRHACISKDGEIKHVPIKHVIASSQPRVMSMHVCVHLYWSVGSSPYLPYVSSISRLFNAVFILWAGLTSQRQRRTLGESVSVADCPARLGLQ